MAVDENGTSAKHQRASSLFKLPTTALFVSMGLVIALLLGGAGGYYISLQQHSKEMSVGNAHSPTLSTVSSPGSLTSPGWVSPTVHIISNPTDTPYPPEKFVVRSQALSPDGTRKIMFKAPETLVYGNPQELIVADASGNNQTIVLSQDFVGGSFDAPKPTNWSPHGSYVFVPEGDGLYVFKANGAVFSNGKRYLLASELGYPAWPFTAKWTSDTQIQMFAHRVGPIDTHESATYKFDVQKGTVTLER
jgi:hypothetical protein